jgi:hypothetical protein
MMKIVRCIVMLRKFEANLVVVCDAIWIPKYTCKIAVNIALCGLRSVSSIYRSVVRCNTFLHPEETQQLQRKMMRLRRGITGERNFDK